jgi:hypothetical protein
LGYSIKAQLAQSGYQILITACLTVTPRESRLAAVNTVPGLDGIVLGHAVQIFSQIVLEVLQ